MRLFCPGYDSFESCWHDIILACIHLQSTWSLHACMHRYSRRPIPVISFLLAVLVHVCRELLGVLPAFGGLGCTRAPADRGDVSSLIWSGVLSPVGHALFFSTSHPFFGISPPTSIPPPPPPPPSPRHLPFILYHYTLFLASLWSPFPPLFCCRDIQARGTIVNS